MNSPTPSERTGSYDSSRLIESNLGRNDFRRICNPVSGFTLLEILVTLAIFAIIAATIFGSFNMVFTNTESIHERIATYEMAKNGLNRMLLDIQSLYADTTAYKTPDIADTPDPYRVVGDKTYFGAESFSRLRFASLAHLSFSEQNQDGIAQIVYYVQESDENHYILRRSDSLFPYKPIEEIKNDPILCENIRSLKFTYYDQAGVTYENWDSDTDDFGYATPGAIGIELEIGTESRAFRFETMVTIPMWREKKG